MHWLLVHDQYGATHPWKLAVALPDWHWLEKAHHPQPPSWVQDRQDDAGAQFAVGAGVAGHDCVVQYQYGVVHPVKLPVWLPDWHVPLYVHQPQSPSPVQDAQVVAVMQLCADAAMASNAKKSKLRLFIVALFE
jgi:hypothetical protein